MMSDISRARIVRLAVKPLAEAASTREHCPPRPLAGADSRKREGDLG
jgi:hypothetical protein